MIDRRCINHPAEPAFCVLSDNGKALCLQCARRLVHTPAASRRGPTRFISDDEWDNELVAVPGGRILKRHQARREAILVAGPCPTSADDSHTVSLTAATALNALAVA